MFPVHEISRGSFPEVSRREVDPSSTNKVEYMPLTIVDYESLCKRTEDSIIDLILALQIQGIVGVWGAPNYKKLTENFFEQAIAFSQLSPEEKAKYAPIPNGFLGFETGAEKFRRPDGEEVVDASKASYYALVPDHTDNRFPIDGGLKRAYLEIGDLMIKVGSLLMERIGLLGKGGALERLNDNQMGRMLHYTSSADTNNPYACGAHYDHGLFTALLPAVYLDRGQKILEPEEAGLFVRAPNEAEFKKVHANNPDVMLFQVGEAGQLILNGITATEHRVHKAPEGIERHTMAVFFAPPFDYQMESDSILSQDGRFGDGPTCSYVDWHLRSLARYRA